MVKNQLYQTRHIRPQRNIAIEIDCSGMTVAAANKGLIRLGGEARGAAYTVFDAAATLLSPPKTGVNEVYGLTVTLLTPLSVSQEDKDNFTPFPGFLFAEQGGISVWQGEVNGIPLTLESAVTGKAIREGGWNMADKCPRDAQCLLPAGSVFYFKVGPDDLQAAINAIHLQQPDQAADEKALGRGLMAVGLWLRHESQGE